MLSVIIWKYFKIELNKSIYNYAPVAQQDRALGYWPGGSGSNPSRRNPNMEKF